MPVMTPLEVDEVELQLGVRFPSLYRQLLVTIGHGRHGNVEIYHPNAIRELFEPFFDDPTQLFATYFPFGCNNRYQELWVIDSVAERAASIAHDTVPDDWPDEQWLRFDAWCAHYLCDT